MTPTRLQTHVRGLRIHARELGGSQRSRGTFVLVPGLSISGRYMLPLAERLATRYRVLIPDPPGAGLSMRPRRPLSPREHAHVLAAWMARLRIDDAWVLGNSIGCLALLHLGHLAPRSARALILSGLPMEPARRTLWGQFTRFATVALREPPSLWALALRDYARAGVRTTWRTAKLAVEDRFERVLPHVAPPVLLVRGEFDALSPIDWNQQVARRLPRAHVATIRGAPHALNYDAPGPLARLADGFVTALERRWARSDFATRSGASMVEKWPTPSR